MIGIDFLEILALTTTLTTTLEITITTAQIITRSTTIILIINFDHETEIDPVITTTLVITNLITMIDPKVIVNLEIDTEVMIEVMNIEIDLEADQQLPIYEMCILSILLMITTMSNLNYSFS